MSDFFGINVPSYTNFANVVFIKAPNLIFNSIIRKKNLLYNLKLNVKSVSESRQ